MVELSLEAINSNAPYKVLPGLKKHNYRFVSESNIEFGVSFEEDETLILSSESYQFGVFNNKGKKSPRDSKVRETIVAIVEEFFQKNQAALLYICETGDGKQAMRGRLFSYWFETYRNREAFLILPLSINDEEGIENFAALIIRRDNPQFNDVVTEFSNTINMLQGQKPKD